MQEVSPIKNYLTGMFNKKQGKKDDPMQSSEPQTQRTERHNQQHTPNDAADHSTSNQTNLNYNSQNQGLINLNESLGKLYKP